MDDYISREAAVEDDGTHKVKTPFAKIIVGGTPEKPCYYIWYFDPADGEMHIGFGSYRLEYVFGWIAEEFEVTGPCTDVTAVRHGRWEGTADGYADGELVYDMWACSECGFDADGAEEKPEWKYCPNCGAQMDGGAENG